MKQKDLKVGEIYADKSVKPYRLLSMRLWRKDRDSWSSKSFYYPARQGDRMAQDYNYSVGRLALSLALSPANSGDSVEVLKSVEIPDWFESPAPHYRGLNSDYVERMREFSESLPRGLRLSAENTGQWVGPYLEAQQAHDEEEARLNELRDKAKDVSADYYKRLRQVEVGLLASGVAGEVGYVKVSEEERIYVRRPATIALKIEDLENLLGIERGL